jgi:hypothetical protein
MTPAANTRDHLAETGWMRFDEIVPTDVCDAVVDLMCDHAGVPRDHDGPYEHEHPTPNGVIPIYHHPALWVARQLPAVHEAFAEGLGTRRLWVELDRCGLKPTLPPEEPIDPRRPHYLHTDESPDEWTGGAHLQGMLYLTETDETMGPLQVIPEAFRERTNGSRTSWSWAEQDDYPIELIPGRAGTLVVWDSRLPHSSGWNTSGRPRFTQYISMSVEGSETERARRVNEWRTAKAPARHTVRAGQLDPEPWPAVPLTPLGEKLLGLTPWGDESTNANDDALATR